MSITQRCNYAGTSGKLIPTRSFARSLLERLQAVSGLLARRRN